MDLHMPVLVRMDFLETTVKLHRVPISSVKMEGHAKLTVLLINAIVKLGSMELIARTRLAQISLVKTRESAL